MSGISIDVTDIHQASHEQWAGILTRQVEQTSQLKAYAEKLEEENAALRKQLAERDGTAAWSAESQPEG